MDYIVPFAIQSGDASMPASLGDPKLGKGVIIAGLFVQTIVFGSYADKL